MTTRELMKRNASACNCMLTPDVLNEKADLELLKNCHPLARPEFARQLHLENKLTKDQLKEFIQIL